MGNTDRGTVTVDPTKYFPDDFFFGARSFMMLALSILTGMTPPP